MNQHEADKLTKPADAQGHPHASNHGADDKTSASKDDAELDRETATHADDATDAVERVERAVDHMGSTIPAASEASLRHIESMAEQERKEAAADDSPVEVSSGEVGSFADLDELGEAVVEALEAERIVRDDIADSPESVPADQEPAGPVAGTGDEHPTSFEPSRDLDAEIESLLEQIEPEESFEDVGGPNQSPLIGEDDPELEGFAGKLDDLIASTVPLADETIGRAPTGAAASQPRETSRAAPAVVDPTVMTELDETLADDVGHLIESEPAAVESVLDGIFSARATFVQGEPGVDEGSGAKARRSPAGGEDGERTATGRGERQADAAGATSKRSGTRPPTAASHPADELAGDIADATVVVTREVDRDLADTEKRSRTKEVRQSKMNDNVEVGGNAASEVAADKAASSDAGLEANTSNPGTRDDGQQQAWKSPMAATTPGAEGLVARTVPTLVAALAAMNWPLRQLPEEVRPYVDWFAVTLVFWVPVVWVLAWLVTG